MSCPVCGSAISADAAAQDAYAREAYATIGSMPAQAAQPALVYLGLFRVPGAKRGMVWSKTARMAVELKAMVSSGYVQTAGRPARPATPAMWGAGMLQMVEQRHALKLPMTTHTYLCKVVYDLADASDRAAEMQRNRAERDGRLAAANKEAWNPTGEVEAFGGMSPEEMRKIKEENMKKRKVEKP